MDNHTKQSLDRWLTTPPDDGSDKWFDAAFEAFSEDFFQKNEGWILEDNGECNKRLNELFNNGTSPEDAAQVIENERNKI